MDLAKEKLGRNATVIWLIGGTLLFLKDGGFKNVISIQSIAFLIIGMFVAAIIAGGFSYWIIVKLSKYLANRFGNPNDPNTKNVMILSGYIFYLIHFTICILFVFWCYVSFFGNY